jgi:hypothetical protein
MTQEQFDQAKSILEKISDLEKKAADKSEYNTVKVMVSSNGVYFTELASIIGVDDAERYKSDIINNCNNFKKGIEESINDLKTQFDKI